MGTNYYTATEPCEKACEHCSQQTELHIGKSSGGWKFGFRGHPDLGLTSWSAWQAFLVGRPITDEYGAARTLDEFRKVVEERWTPRDMDRPICRVEPTAREIAGGFGGRFEPHGNYHDPDGFDFYDGEFS
jgi:hypothetical protein